MDKLYFKVPNMISKDACELLGGALLLCEQGSNPNGPEFNDRQSMGAFSRYRYSGTDALMFYLLPKMEELTGKTLKPTFSYSRVYRNGHDLWKHVDRGECEYSATITLKTDGTPWPIVMGEESLELEQGSACVYKGPDIPHYREPYTGNEHVQVFVHYVDVNGKYADTQADVETTSPYR